MQDIYCRELYQILLTTKETYYGITPVAKKVSPLYVFEDKRCYRRTPIIYKKQSTFC